MSSTVRGFQLRDLTQHGKPELYRVSVASAVVLPATATGTIFTVTGCIAVTGLLGFVTTVLSSTAVSPTIGFTPSAGTAQPAGIAAAPSVAYASTAVGSVVVMPTSLGGPLPAPVTSLETATACESFVVENGAITITTASTNTGALTWLLTWVPLFPKTNYSAGSGGPTVTAA